MYFSSDIFPSAFTHTKDPPRQFSQTRRRALSRAHNSPLRLLHVLFMRIFLFPPPVYIYLSLLYIYLSFSLSLLSLSLAFLHAPEPSRRSAPNVFYAKRSHFRNAPRPGSRLSRSRNIHVNNFRRCVCVCVLFFSPFFRRARDFRCGANCSYEGRARNALTVRDMTRRVAGVVKYATLKRTESPGHLSPV